MIIYWNQVTLGTFRLYFVNKETKMVEFPSVLLKQEFPGCVISKHSWNSITLKDSNILESQLFFLSLLNWQFLIIEK